MVRKLSRHFGRDPIEGPNQARGVQPRSSSSMHAGAGPMGWAPGPGPRGWGHRTGRMGSGHRSGPNRPGPFGPGPLGAAHWTRPNWAKPRSKRGPESEPTHDTERSPSEAHVICMYVCTYVSSCHMNSVRVRVWDRPQFPKQVPWAHSQEAGARGYRHLSKVWGLIIGGLPGNWGFV